MRRLLRRGPDGERGATLVEFALVAPIIFLFFGAFFDIGLSVLGSSVATNAAREGARIGIINYLDADVDSPVPSVNNQKVVDAAEAKLVGLIGPASSGESVVVACIDGDDQDVEIPCDTNIRIDHDLIEVTVHWTSISPTGGIFTADSYTSKARMVITGGIGGSGGACNTSGGTIALGPPTAVSVAEATPALTITATRSVASPCATTVGFAMSDGTADAGDYNATTGTLGFLPGQTTTSLTIDDTVIQDVTPEPDETFLVSLVGGTEVNGTIGGGPITVTIVDDDAAPGQLSSIVMYDVDIDGRIDRLIADFDQNLAAGCPDPGAFTFPTQPGGISVQGVSISGDDATITLNEGNVDTSNTNFTVQLATGCLTDVNGNPISFGPTTPLDNANPVLVTLADSDTTGNDNGTFQAGDWLDFTFSEPLNPSTLVSSSATVTLTDPAGGSTNSVTMPGVLSTANALNHDGYLDQDNTVANFPNSTMTFANGNRTLRVTLVNACVGACGNNVRRGGQSDVTFVFDPALRDTNNLPIVPPSPVNNLRLF